MTQAADRELPVFDRGGQAPLSNPDTELSGILGGRDPDLPDDILSDDDIQAENSRPDLPDETPDGLDDTEEEVRRQAEDLPLDTAGR